MTPRDLVDLAADPEPRSVILAKDQPQYDPLPALVYNDGRVLTEWTFTEEERERIIRGENLRLWVWTCGRPFPPVALQITDEDMP